MILYWDSVDFIWGVSRNLPLLQPWGEWGPLAGERQWAIRVESGYDAEDLGLKSVCLTLSSWSPLPNAFLLFILKEYLSEHISMCWVLLAMCLGHCLEIVGRKLSAYFWGNNCIQTWLNHSDFIMFPSLSPTLRLKRSKLTRTLIPKGNAQPPTEHNFLWLFCYHLLCGTSWPRSSGLWISDQFKFKFGPGLIPLENSAKFMSLPKHFEVRL